METATYSSIIQQLDEAHELVRQGRVRAALDGVIPTLKELKQSSPPQEWDQVWKPQVMSHPLCQVLHEDPFTRRSFDKPRGYSGDANLLDYMYGESGAAQETSELGRQIFEYTTRSPASSSVNARRYLLAGEIDEVAAEFPQPRVLSIACGPLREAGLSRAVAEGRIGEFTAMDQDPVSLEQVERMYGHLGVKTMSGSVKGILCEKIKFQGMHLVYAAGVYDYLGERVASRMTRLLFDMLAPGGRLLVANFAPCLRDIGYMETFMGWNLLYREPEEVAALAKEIRSDEWKSNRLFWDEFSNIVFLEITKRNGPVDAPTVQRDAGKLRIRGRDKVAMAAGLAPKQRQMDHGAGSGQSEAAST